VTYDTTDPETQITGGPSGTITTNSATFTYTGSDNITPTASLVYATYLQGYDSGWSSFSSATSKSYSNLPNGSYTFQVKARDLAGLEDLTPATRAFTVNYTPPNLPPNTTVSSGPSGTITVSSATFTYMGSDDVTPTGSLQYATYLQWYDRGWSSFGSATSRSYSNLPNGSYTFQVKARDQAGAEDPSPATRAFTVNYTPPTFALTVQGGGNGTGVVSSPSGVSCSINGTNESGDCSENYISGTQVTLTADPTGGSIFTGWSGGGCSNTNPCTVTMNQAHTVTSFFYVPGPPVISGISQELLQVNADYCVGSDGKPFTGSIFRIHFFYDDPDGDVSKSDGAKVIADSFDSTTWSSFSGDGFTGSIGSDVCYRFGSATSRTCAIKVIDGMAHESNSLSIKLPKPEGAE
jgi:hypothetical protein